MTNGIPLRCRSSANAEPPIPAPTIPTGKILGLGLGLGLGLVRRSLILLDESSLRLEEMEVCEEVEVDEEVEGLSSSPLLLIHVLLLSTA